jgi:hypothetical protein
MTILRFVIDVESDGDANQSTLNEMADRLNKYADSVVAPQYLAEKQGDDGQITYHVHRSDRRHHCEDCLTNAQDQRGA